MLPRLGSIRAAAPGSLRGRPHGWNVDDRQRLTARGAVATINLENHVVRVRLSARLQHVTDGEPAEADVRAVIPWR